MKVLSVVGMLLLASTLSFGQSTPDKKADAPAPPVATAPAQAPKPDTPAVIKARLKGYKLQQKAAMELAKAQTKQQLAQLKLQAAAAKAERAVAIAQAESSK